MISHEMTSTTFDMPGFRVVRGLGIVRGIVVRSRSIFGNIGASLQTLVGGDITLFSNLCEKTREEAFMRMMRLRRKWAPTQFWASATMPPKSWAG